MGNSMCKYKVLIIDDDKLVTWSLSRDLEMEGCEVENAVNGKSGITAFRENTFIT